MDAQNELKAVFQELDAQSDRVLCGLRAVRSSAKIKTLQPSPILSAAPLGLGAAAASLIMMWFNSGPVS